MVISYSSPRKLIQKGRENTFFERSSKADGASELVIEAGAGLRQVVWGEGGVFLHNLENLRAACSPLASPPPMVLCLGKTLGLLTLWGGVEVRPEGLVSEKVEWENGTCPNRWPIH